MLRNRRFSVIAMICMMIASLVLLGSSVAADSSGATAAVAGGSNYYVSPDGDDANDGRSLSTPWKTLDKASEVLDAGDTLLLRGGEYVDNFFNPVHSGEEGNPITLKAYNGEIPVITGNVKDINAFILIDHQSYFVIDGLHFENTVGTNGVVFTTRANHITISNCQFKNNDGASHMVLNGNYYVIENNVFNGTGYDLLGAGEGDNIYLLGVKYALIQNNHFSGAGHYAVDQIEDHSYGEIVYSEYNVIRNNVVDSGKGGGFGLIRGTKHAVIENNIIKNTGIGVPNYPKAGIQVAAEENIIRNNIITKSGSETKGDSGLAIESYNFNTIAQNATDNRIYNNVIYDSGKEAVFFTQRNETDNARNKLENNIMYHNRVSGPSNQWWNDGNIYIMVETYHAAQDHKWPYYMNDNELNNNIILHGDANGDYPGYSPLFYYDQEGWYKSLAEVELEFPNALRNNLEQNPQFVDAENDDFNLLGNSPAIDAGKHLTHTTSAGNQVTQVPVDDPWYFFDGFTIVYGDTVRIGNNAPVQITNVDYETKVLTVASPVTFEMGDYVDLPYNGLAPDMGVNEQPVSFAALHQLVAHFAGMNELRNELLIQVQNKLGQAEDHKVKGHTEQAVKHLQDMLKHLNNPAKAGEIEDDAKAILSHDVNELISSTQAGS